MPALSRKKIGILIVVALALATGGILLWMQLSRKPHPGPIVLPKRGPAFLQAQYEPWADSMLAGMSNREKIAQLVMVELEGNESYAPVKETPFGGVFYRHTSLAAHINLYNTLREQQRVLPFFAVEAPFGLVALSDSSMAPPPYSSLMTFSDDSLFLSTARYVAGQCKALSIHINFSPSYDLIEQNTDPAFDPGYKTFADQLTARSIAYGRILADSGVIACMGSFLNLGTEQPVNREFNWLKDYARQWDTLRIKPYRQLADSGAQAVWVNHYPHFMERQDQDAFFLNKPAIRDSLVKCTGFTGLVFGDLRDPGLRGYYTMKEAALASLLTGSDMLVVPDSAAAIVDYLSAKLGSGGFTRELLDRKVKKILMAKAWSGIPRQGAIDLVEVARSVDQRQDFVISEQLFASSLVLLQDRKRLLPLTNIEKRNVAVISAGKQKHSTFVENMSWYIPVSSFALDPKSDPQRYEKFTQELKSFNTLVVAISPEDVAPEDTFFISYLQKLGKSKDMAVVLFGDHRTVTPYAGFSTLLLTFGYSRMAERVAGQFVMGGWSSSGRLPVSCSGQFCYADGLHRRKTRVAFSLPEAVGMSSSTLTRVDSIAQTSIRQQAMPGCQVVVIKNGYVVLRRSYGFHTYSREQPVENSDIYDLASVTKVAATTIGIMKLYDEGRLKLDTTLSAYLPDLEQSELRSVKIRDVLIHQAGFPAVPPVFRYIRAIQKFRNNKGKISPVTNVNTTAYDTLFGPVNVKESDTLYRYAFAEEESKEYSLPIAEGIYLRNDMPDSIYLLVTKTKLVKPIEYKYSDMSMYIMMQVLQHITHATLDEYMQRNFYTPLGLQTTGFNPMKRYAKERIVPTEEDDIFRKQLMHGHVHDPIASLLGGVSGHAGLFSDGLDLALLMQMVLNGGSYGGRQYFSSETVKLFTSPQPGSYRGLGWDHNYSSGNPMCADSSSVFTYGHTGFTGTCVWVDPKYDLVYVFLSNRIYPTAENKKLQTSAVRQRIHQVIYDAMRRR